MQTQTKTNSGTKKPFFAENILSANDQRRSKGQIEFKLICVEKLFSTKSEEHFLMLSIPNLYRLHLFAQVTL
jgi:hypothetical protein